MSQSIRFMRDMIISSVCHKDKVYELVTVVQSDSCGVMLREVARASNSLHSLH